MRILITITFLLCCSISLASDNISARPNNFGGYNFYSWGKSIGNSRSSSFGGQKFYDRNGRMGHLYGNGSGTIIYKGNANFGSAGNKGAVLQNMNGLMGRNKK